MIRTLLLCSLLLWGPGLAAAPASSQWYDRFHSGHGLDLNRAAGTLFGTFYTYDAGGEPEWLWIELPDAIDVAGELTRFRRSDGHLVSARAGSFSLRRTEACADGLPRPGAEALYRFDFELGGAAQSWCLEALLPAAAVAESVLDGHWFVPGDDGWGLVTHHYPQGGGTETFQVLYFPDASGAPRWAFAQHAVGTLVQDLEFATLRTGCPGCPAADASYAVIGRARVELRSSNASAEGNRISVALDYGPGPRFERDVALALLSAPRSVQGAASTRQGPARGTGGDGVDRFFNLPFAAPPVGALRFRAPQGPALRDGVQDARSVGPGCIQTAGASPFGAAPARQSEDCLQLNIWRPAGEGPFPVLVWIHGGGSIFGSAVDAIGDRLSYDGNEFARQGVVFVSINYRLNAFGFLSMREFAGEAADQPGTGNYGLLDQVAALRWVSGNIAAFAGDPANVTIFGESAGGVSVCNLLASPLARGLFAKAIMQSGNCLKNPIAPAAALAQGDRVVAAAGCAGAAEGTRNCMRALGAQPLLAAAAPGINIGFGGTGESYGASLDGFALVDSPAGALASGAAAQVPFMLGVNDDEATSLVPASTLPATAAGYEALVRSKFAAIGNAVLARYPAAAYPAPQQAWQDLVDDLSFACAARRAAADHAARGNAVYHYALTEIFPDQPALQSFHGMDVALLFGPRPTAQAPERQLGAWMRAAWIGFARSGDPGAVGGVAWPRYDALRRSLELRSGAPAVIGDYRSEYCGFWAMYVPL